MSIFSGLVDEIRPVQHKKYQARLGFKVSYIIVHYWASSGYQTNPNMLQWVLNKFVYANNKSSVHYILTSPGRLIGSVSEKFRAWTSNSWIGDRRGITIEVENETGKPDYRISDEAIEELIQFFVDVARRYGWKRIRFGHEVRGHREFYATSCPGDWFWARLPNIAKEADRRLQGGTPSTPAPLPSKPAPSKPAVPVSKRWPHATLLVDGVFGVVTKRAYQTLLAGIDLYRGRLDGDFARISIIAEQTWLARLGHYRGKIDGQRGPLTIKALQAFLRAKGLYKGLIDGVHGPLTTRALQQYLNAQAKYFKKK